MTIGIVGSRRRDTPADYKAVFQAWRKIGGDTDRLVSGGCPAGADRYAEFIAKRYQRTITIHYAPWDRLGKGAGFARNTFVAMDADILIACPSVDRTGGTEDTINKFLLRNLPKDNLILV